MLSAAAPLHTALATDVDACLSSVVSQSALLARLRALVEAALDRRKADRSAISAYYDSLIAD